MGRETSGEGPGLVVALRQVLDDPADPDAAAVRWALLDRGWRPPERPLPGDDGPVDTTAVTLLALGFSASETAHRLGVPLTVLTGHLVRLRAEHGCTSTAEALRRARTPPRGGGGH